MPVSCRFVRHIVHFTCARAYLRLGSRIAMIRAMIATTTNTSISVNPRHDFGGLCRPRSSCGWPAALTGLVRITCISIAPPMPCEMVGPATERSCSALPDVFRLKAPLSSLNGYATTIPGLSPSILAILPERGCNNPMERNARNEVFVTRWGRRLVRVDAVDSHQNRSIESLRRRRRANADYSTCRNTGGELSGTGHLITQVGSWRFLYEFLDRRFSGEVPARP